MEERTILSYSAGVGKEETKHWRPPHPAPNLRARFEEEARVAGLGWKVRQDSW